MSARSRSLLTGALTFLGSFATAQSATPTPSPKTPPPPRLPIAALVPEAFIEVAGASDFAFTEDALWAAGRATGEVSRIDAKTNAITHRLTIGPDLCLGLAADFGGVFVPRCATAVMARIDSKTHAPGDPITTPMFKGARSIATGVGSVWAIADERGSIARIDPIANVVVAEIHTSPGAVSLAFGDGALWVANPEKNTVTRINPHNNLIVEEIKVAGGPAAIATGQGSVWTWNRADGSITRLDAKTNTVAATIKLGEGSGEGRVAAGEGSVWITRAGVPLARIDPRTNQVAQIFTGATSGPIAIALGSVWIAASPTTVWRLDPRRIEATRAAVPPGPRTTPSPAPAPTATPR